MTDIVLDYRVPAPDVADFVTLFYYFKAEVPFFEDTERADHAQLRFRLDTGTAEYRFPDGRMQIAGDVHILGPTCSPRYVRADSPDRIELWGIGITAAGWAAMIGGDASNALNGMADASKVLGPRLAPTLAALRAAKDSDERAAIGTALVKDLICNANPDIVAFARQVDGWLDASTSPDIDDLIDATGLSRRQVERKCNALYGAPPKMLARKFRALRAAVAMCSGELSFDDAVGLGFYDQSHLIREVKQFTALTPKQIRDQPSDLAAITVRERVALGEQVREIIGRT